MGSTNILIWNPSNSNQEADAAYTADGQRIGGATSPSEFLSALANKLFNQVSLVPAALGQSLAGKGFVVSDGTTPYVAAPTPTPGTPEAVLTAVLNNLLTTADYATIITNVFAGAAHGSNANGYYLKLPPSLGSYVIQFGKTANFPSTSYYGSVSGSFPIAFPTACVAMIPNPNNFAQGNVSFPMTVVVNALSASGYTVTANSTNSGLGIASGTSAYWIAIGY